MLLLLLCYCLTFSVISKEVHLNNVVVVLVVVYILFTLLTFFHISTKAECVYLVTLLSHSRCLSLCPAELF